MTNRELIIAICEEILGIEIEGLNNRQIYNEVYKLIQDAYDLMDRQNKLIENLIEEIENLY